MTSAIIASASAGGSGSGNLGTSRSAAMYTDSIEQLRGATGPRQVKVRAETAPAAFTTPSSGG
ncbi:MAG: hypothetical protein WAV02_20925 [Stellaceae bacterium]